MIQRIQTLPTGQRYLIFFMIFGGGLMFIVGVVVFLFTFTLNSANRVEAEALIDGVSVREFTTLSDDEAYPASLAIGLDGTVYTASYSTGAVWEINPNGIPSELTDFRDILDSVTGLAVDVNGNLYINGIQTVSEDEEPRSSIWRYAPDGTLTQVGSISPSDELNDEFIVPDDITVDSVGNIYVADRTRREVWQITPDGNAFSWWSAPEEDDNADDVIPTGLHYDVSTDTLLITDSEENTIYRVQMDGLATEIVYRYDESSDEPSFDGLTVAPNGTIYVAALAENTIGTIENGELIYIVGNFRGASDVDYYDGHLYVTNFDSRSLVDPLRDAQLPFGLDIIDLNSDAVIDEEE